MFIKVFTQSGTSYSVLKRKVLCFSSSVTPEYLEVGSMSLLYHVQHIIFICDPVVCLVCPVMPILYLGIIVFIPCFGLSTIIWEAHITWDSHFL